MEFLRIVYSLSMAALAMVLLASGAYAEPQDGKKETPEINNALEKQRFKLPHPKGHIEPFHIMF